MFRGKDKILSPSFRKGVSRELGRKHDDVKKGGQRGKKKITVEGPVRCGPLGAPLGVCGGESRPLDRTSCGGKRLTQPRGSTHSKEWPVGNEVATLERDLEEK